MKKQGSFCWGCGNKNEKKALKCETCSALLGDENQYQGIPALGAGGIGWFEDFNHPNFAKNKKKMGKAGLIQGAVAGVIIPIVILFSADMDFSMETLMAIGTSLLIVWGTMFAFYVWKYSVNKKGWEGIVENKIMEEKTRSVEISEDKYRNEKYTQYTVFLRKQDGSTGKITDETGECYKKYNEGERVRIHGGKTISGYEEKYDKSKEKVLRCANCTMQNDVRNNFCFACAIPIIKAPNMTQIKP